MSEPDFKYPRKLNIKLWEAYIGRALSYEEKFLIELCKSEKHMNKMMSNLYTHLSNKSQKYYVPSLTNLDGNCLFESLNYHKIGDSVEELRTMLSMVFYIFQNYNNFLPGMDTTLKELFNFTNEIEYVSTTENCETKYYKYSYSVMCQDLGNLRCWSRLPTQLILLVISYLFKIEIIIINSNNGYETKINAYESTPDISDIKKVYLGHLGESHYVPVDINQDDQSPCYPIYYEKSTRELMKWGQMVEYIKTKQYSDQQESKKQLEKENNTQINEEFSELKIDSCVDEVTF